MSLRTELVKGSGQAFLIEGLGKALGFIAQTLLASWLNAEGYGVFSYVVTVVTLFSLLGQLGLHTTVLRFVAAYNGQKDWTNLRGVLVVSNALCIASSVTMVILGEAIIWAMRGRLDENMMLCFQIGLLLVPVLIFSGLRQHALRGLKFIIAALAPEFLLVPVVLIAGVSFLKLFSVASALAAIWLQFLATLSAFLCGAWLLARNLPKQVRESKAAYRVREILAVSLPLLVVVASQQVMAKTDIILLGVFCDIADVGVYSMVLRISAIVSFGLNVINVVAAPLIAESFARNDRKRLDRVVALTALIGSISGLAMFSLIAVFGGTFLSFIGSRFVIGMQPLLILIVGHMANCLAGPVGQLMVMTGHEKSFSMIMIWSAVINVSLNLFLIMELGMTGAAIASMLTTVIWNLWSGRMIYRSIGLNPTVIRRDLLKQILAVARLRKH